MSLYLPVTSYYDEDAITMRPLLLFTPAAYAWPALLRLCLNMVCSSLPPSIGYVYFQHLLSTAIVAHTFSGQHRFSSAPVTMSALVDVCTWWTTFCPSQLPLFVIKIVQYLQLECHREV